MRVGWIAAALLMLASGISAASAQEVPGLVTDLIERVAAASKNVPQVDPTPASVGCRDFEGGRLCRIEYGTGTTVNVGVLRGEVVLTQWVAEVAPKPEANRQRAMWAFVVMNDVAGKEMGRIGKLAAACLAGKPEDTFKTTISRRRPPAREFEFRTAEDGCIIQSIWKS